jgi:adenylate cyclase class 2
MNECDPSAGKRLCWLAHALATFFPSTLILAVPGNFVTGLYSTMAALLHNVRLHTVREIEIKLRVPDVPTMIRDLRRLGATLHGRVLERNTVYDTLDEDFRSRHRLLRLRIETPAPSDAVQGGRARAVVTSKSRPSPSAGRRYKENLEREASLRHWRTWPAILRYLGLRPRFRYEKYRTAFRVPGLHLDLDETPAGDFLELEGAPRAIDRVARTLGYSPRDYIRDTYWDLFQAECRRRGYFPKNMLFQREKVAKRALFA